MVPSHNVPPTPLLPLSLLGVLVGLRTDVTAVAHLILPFIAGGFLYIAMADLMPDFLKTPSNMRYWWDFLAIFSGIVSVYVLLAYEAT